MANKITIKVVSQILNLRYQGTAVRKTSAAASRMSALLGVDTVGKSPGSPEEKSSRSYVLYENQIRNGSNPGQDADSVGPVTFAFDQALAYFEGCSDAKATDMRKTFFASVEAGKKSLYEKYGERIPNEELLGLSKKLSGVACVIWKHQVITTKTGDTQFPGARRNRDGSWTASVKSRTIYTMAPLSETQLDELKLLVTGQKSSVHLAERKSVETPRGVRHAFISDAGNVILREITPSDSGG